MRSSISKEDPILIEKSKIDFKKKGIQRKQRAFDALKEIDEDLARQVIYKEEKKDFSSRKKERERKLRPEERAALRIQAFWRGIKGRVLFQEMEYQTIMEEEERLQAQQIKELERGQQSLKLRVKQQKIKEANMLHRIKEEIRFNSAVIIQKAVRKYLFKISPSQEQTKKFYESSDLQQNDIFENSSPLRRVQRIRNLQLDSGELEFEQTQQVKTPNAATMLRPLNEVIPDPLFHSPGEEEEKEKQEILSGDSSQPQTMDKFLRMMNLRGSSSENSSAQNAQANLDNSLNFLLNSLKRPDKNQFNLTKKLNEQALFIQEAESKYEASPDLMLLDQACLQQLSVNRNDQEVKAINSFEQRFSKEDCDLITKNFGQLFTQEWQNPNEKAEIENKHQMVSVMDDSFAPVETPKQQKKELQIQNQQDDDAYNKYLRESSTNKKSQENIFSLKKPKKTLPINLEEQFSSSEDTDKRLNESDFPLTQLIKERTLVYKQKSMKKQNLNKKTEEQILADKFELFQELIEEFNSKNLELEELANKRVDLENKNQMFQSLLIQLRNSRMKQEQLQKPKKRAVSLKKQKSPQKKVPDINQILQAIPQLLNKNKAQQAKLQQQQQQQRIQQQQEYEQPIQSARQAVIPIVSARKNVQVKQKEDQLHSSRPHLYSKRMQQVTKAPKSQRKS